MGINEVEDNVGIIEKHKEDVSWGEIFYFTSNIIGG